MFVHLVAKIVWIGTIACANYIVNAAYHSTMVAEYHWTSQSNEGDDMKATMEPTPEIWVAIFNGVRIPLRIWKGTTPGGVMIEAHVLAIMPVNGEQQESLKSEMPAYMYPFSNNYDLEPDGGGFRTRSPPSNTKLLPPVDTLLRNALEMAQMALEQGGNLSTHVTANGPTVGEVINRALRMK
jgi:hypothetical protein